MEQCQEIELGLSKEVVSLKDLLAYFLKLGTFGFGGPIALTAAMQRDLVDDRGWFSQEEFRQGMVLSQLAPGPLAAQLAIYFGWAHSKICNLLHEYFTFPLKALNPSLLSPDS